MKEEKHYSEQKLWQKIKRVAKKAGTSVIYAVLILYYVLQKPEVPTKVKGVIIAALGYFILPLDLIPDIAVGVGYTDDLGVLVSAIITASMYIDEDVKEEAKEKLHSWFGDDIDTSEIDNKLGSPLEK
ncbi:YkvA family protein [Priestia taiwanensis]|uniref:DUF1232 domain-containing protein n=1 Tax=Priestia taiwanensis TaxID=1347902 RepID=A0A917AJI8_9BACI|nr:YkvA family protein [Priestia taiwanensis]MBM7361752.1 uncharacterized membrane protein YkvA (DUF1232 family) [Priestia taiwanensis]GGE56706.1 hypothetical protein GCM10007140_03790 [Priestia taiwanensis]